VSEPPPPTYVETRRRSFAKAISWRIIATIITAAVVVIMTGEWELGAKVGLFDTSFKFILYFAHERLWTRIGFGRTSYKDYQI
jgi:uncharacterized membrane protein